MHRVDADTYIAFDLLSASPGFDTHGESDIATLGRSCSETLDHGKVSFGTEAGLFHDAAIPAIICGPGHIAQAHQPNEWVAVDQLKRCEAFMQRLVDARHARVTASLPPIEVEFPDLARWARRQCRHSLRLDVRPRIGPVRTCLLQALTHGNEVCGAIALDWLLSRSVPPGAGNGLVLLCQRRRLRHVRPGRPVRFALRRGGLQPACGRRTCSTARGRPPISRALASCGRSTTASTTCSISTR